MLGQLAALGLLATSAWLVATSSLRPPILTLSAAIAAVRLLALVRGAGRYGERLASHDVALRSLARVRLGAYRHLERLVPGGLGDIDRCDVLARVVADIDATQDLVVRIAVSSITAVGTAAAAVALTGLVLPVDAAVLGAGLVFAGVVVPAAARQGGRRVARRRAERPARQQPSPERRGTSRPSQGPPTGPPPWLPERRPWHQTATTTCCPTYASAMSRGGHRLCSTSISLSPQAGGSR
jgi:ABC-type transport system involved in cytochrome bd biosynthesis fused ATPase/permease subunit